MTDATRRTDADLYEANHRHPVNRAFHAAGQLTVPSASTPPVTRQ